ALAFLYATVLVKLGRDWWTDENYSHGLLVPFVICYIIWLEFDSLRSTHKKPEFWIGLSIVFSALLMLLAGTLGAELFVQRISLVLILIGIVIYFFGRKVLQKLVVPFALLLLAIPIPQIIFNKIAFPLQMLASKAADWGIKLFNISTTRRGNVIELVPRGQTQAVGLEVVEACSGIRSLMTLMALALILGYFTRERREYIAENWFSFVKTRDFWRIIILMVSAVPIALLTNAARVMTTGVLTYYYGIQMAEGTWHDLAGWAVFITALILMILLNSVLKRFDRGDAAMLEYSGAGTEVSSYTSKITSAQTVVLFIAILTGGVFINWFENRGELSVERLSLSEMPVTIGKWEHKGGDVSFNAATESVLRASDYVMRYYFSPEGYINFYAGYYASQRSGATYHSPQNCMPGSGWEMKEPGLVEIKTPNGRSFTANRYIVQNGEQRQILIYWYQGRGRVTASEYLDKIYTSWDSFTTRRSDGAMIRVMTPVRDDEAKALQAAIDFSSQVADEIGAFVPD
ncbi:MAG: EpsI family protein, partial [Acidobacteriota bacterium]|nr:EpsI family protein [Acidobacteriota bacterium]